MIQVLALLALTLLFGKLSKRINIYAESIQVRYKELPK